MKKCIYFNLFFIVSVFMYGCTGSAQEENGGDWILNEVDKYNNNDLRQIDIREKKETVSGELTKKQTVILDKGKNCVYIHMLKDGPGDFKEEYINYLGIDASQAFNIYKYGSQKDYYKTTEITEESVKEYLNGRRLNFSDKAEIKILGEDKINNKNALKVQVIDRDFVRLQDEGQYKEMITVAKAADKDEYEKEYNNYMNVKEKRWTLWFLKDSHKLKRVSFDNSEEEAFVLFLLHMQDTDTNILNERPIKGMTVWDIKMGNECEPIQVPDALEYSQ